MCTRRRTSGRHSRRWTPPYAGTRAGFVCVPPSSAGPGTTREGRGVDWGHWTRRGGLVPYRGLTGTWDVSGVPGDFGVSLRDRNSLGHYQGGDSGRRVVVPAPKVRDCRPECHGTGLEVGVDCGVFKRSRKVGPPFVRGPDSRGGYRSPGRRTFESWEALRYDKRKVGRTLGYPKDLNTHRGGGGRDGVGERSTPSLPSS